MNEHFTWLCKNQAFLKIIYDKKRRLKKLMVDREYRIRKKLEKNCIH